MYGHCSNFLYWLNRYMAGINLCVFEVETSADSIIINKRWGFEEPPPLSAPINPNVMRLTGTSPSVYWSVRHAQASTSFQYYSIHIRMPTTSFSDTRLLSSQYYTMSTSKRPTIYQRISSKFQSKTSASNNTLNNELPRDWQSPALDNARIIFQLASNLGSGNLNVPGLQAAGLIGVQIVDAVKVSIIYFSFSVLF